MRIPSRVAVGLVVAVLAVAAVPAANAQRYGNRGYGYGYVGPHYGSGTGIGYNTFNRGYGYGPRYYPVPQTYNNLNGLAGMINQTVLRRQGYYYGNAYRRRLR